MASDTAQAQPLLRKSGPYETRQDLRRLDIRRCNQEKRCFRRAGQDLCTSPHLTSPQRYYAVTRICCVVLLPITIHVRQTPCSFFYFPKTARSRVNNTKNIAPHLDQTHLRAISISTHTTSATNPHPEAAQASLKCLPSPPLPPLESSASLSLRSIGSLSTHRASSVERPIIGHRARPRVLVPAAVHLVFRVFRWVIGDHRDHVHVPRPQHHTRGPRPDAACLTTENRRYKKKKKHTTELMNTTAVLSTLFNLPGKASSHDWARKFRKFEFADTGRR